MAARDKQSPAFLAMLHQLVMASKTYVTQLASDGCSSNGLTRGVEPSRSCNTVVFVTLGQALRHEVLPSSLFRLNLHPSHILPKSKAPTGKAIPWTSVFFLQEQCIIDTESRHVIGFEDGHVHVLFIERLGPVVAPCPLASPDMKTL